MYKKYAKVCKMYRRYIGKGENSIHAVAGMPYKSRLARFLMRMQIVCILQRNRAEIGKYKPILHARDVNKA